MLASYKNMQNCSLVILAGFLSVCIPAAAHAQSPTAQPRENDGPTTPAPPQPGQTHEPPPAQQPSQTQGAGQPNGLDKLPDTISAPPLTVRDKFDYRIVQTLGLRGVVGAAMSAAIGQADGTPYEWGGGVEGYAKRFASSFAGNFSRQTFAWVLESSFHEDPRYFPSEERPKKERLVNALKQVIICKSDSGNPEFAYARVISAFGAGQLSGVWQPKSTSSVAHGFERGFLTLSADAAYNLMQEFLPFTRPVSLRHRH